MKFLHLIPDVQKCIFKKAIIKTAFAKTSLCPFNPKKILNKLPPPPKATPKKDPQSTTINIATPKTLRQASGLAWYIRQNWENQNEDLNKAIQKYIYRAEIQFQAFRYF